MQPSLMGKEKGYSTQSQVHEKTEYGPFGDWQMWGMVKRESHFSNTFITHNFPFAKCTESREAFDIFGPVLIKGTNTMIRRGQMEGRMVRHLWMVKHLLDSLPS